MRNWFLSLNGAITLSVFGLLTWLGRLFLDWAYEIGNYGEDVTLVALIFVAFVGGWVWAMLAAIRGSRRALMVCLVLVLLLDVGFALATYFIWCPPWLACRGFPNLWPWTWAHLIAGLLAALALLFQLRPNKAAG